MKRLCIFLMCLAAVRSINGGTLPDLPGTESPEIGQLETETIIDSHVTGHNEVIDQQEGVQPLLQRSSVQKTSVGIVVDRQSEIKPVVDSDVGDLGRPPIDQSAPANPIVDDSRVTPPSGGVLNEQSKANPFIRSSEPSEASGDEVINQQSDVKPVGSDPKSQIGLLNLQSSMKPVASHHQSSGGHFGNHAGAKPVGSHHQSSGGLFGNQTGGKPPVGSHCQGLGGIVNKPFGHKPKDDHDMQLSEVDSDPHSLSEIVGNKSTVDSDDRKIIGIVNQTSEVNPDGSYSNVWESENGIKVDEEGTVKSDGEDVIQSVRGSIEYTDPHGNPIRLTYIADENGYQPQGDHLPTPPPIPLSVVRALQWIADHPYVEEDDTEMTDETDETTPGEEKLPVIEVA